MMKPHLYFSCEAVGADGTMTTTLAAVAPRHYVIAGWTGRDAAAIEHHIHELGLIGVPAPSTVPLYYRGSALLLTQAETIEVVGPDSSGEVEPVMFYAEGEWWLTVGSDHTDRRVETYSIAVSKQLCPKPTGTAAWRWSDVSAYQDELELISRIFEDGKWVEYQKGTFATIRPLESLRNGCFAGPHMDEGSFVSCGTLGAIPNAKGEGIRAAAQMELEIRDPRRKRSIKHRYSVDVLPLVA
jgi:hypothetical protein